MLADKISERWVRGPLKRMPGHIMTGVGPVQLTTHDLMSRAICIELSRGLVDAASDLLNRTPVDRLAELAAIPYDITWLEHVMEPAGRVGLLIINDGADRRSRVVVVDDMAPGEAPVAMVFEIDWRHGRPLCTAPAHAAQMRHFSAMGLELAIGEDAQCENTLARVCAYLAIIAAPHISHRRDVEPPAKVQRKRALAGRLALLSYSVIDIDWDDAGAERDPSAARSQGAPPRALHPVRGHLRVRDGALIKVRPHWRGSIEAGARVHDFRLYRTEEAQ
jgi:hypothetical protein